MIGLHDILHAIVKRISSVKTVLWLITEPSLLMRYTWLSHAIYCAALVCGKHSLNYSMHIEINVTKITLFQIKTVINTIVDNHTLISDAEANVWVTLVCGEEQVQEVGGADEKLWDLCTLITANQRGRRIASVPYLKNIIVNLCPESVDQNSTMHQDGSFTTKWGYMDSSQSCSLETCLKINNVSVKLLLNCPFER